MKQPIEESAATLLTIDETSEDRHDREEMEWTERSEVLCRTYLERAKASSEAHDKKRKKWKTILMVLSVPSGLVPIASGVIESYLPKLFTLVSLLITGMLTGLIAVYQPGIKMENHDSASAKYDELVIDIYSTIGVPKRTRVAADVVLTNFKLRLINLNNSTPPI